jgi:hypothetical protein
MRRHAGHHIAETACEIDAGRMLHFVVVVEGLDGLSDGLAGLHPRYGALPDEATRRIDDFRTQALGRPGCRAGLSLVVHCGWGRPGVLGLRPSSPDWRVEHITAADLETLSWVPSFSPIELWKMLGARDALAARGVTIMNPNGLVNLYG